MFWHKHHRRRRQCASGEMGAMGRFGKALSVTLLLLLSFPCFLASAATTVRPFLRGAVPGAVRINESSSHKPLPSEGLSFVERDSPIGYPPPPDL